MLVAQAEEGRKQGATFKFFIQKFRAIMDDPSANYKEVNLAIRGYGYFAAVSNLYMEKYISLWWSIEYCLLACCSVNPYSSLGLGDI